MHCLSCCSLDLLVYHSPQDVRIYLSLAQSLQCMELGQAVLSNGSETALCPFSPLVLKEMGESFGKVQFYVRDNSVTEPVSVSGTISCHYLLITQ